MVPTVAPIIDIEIGGKTRKLFMGLKACKSIGLNPMNEAEIEAYMKNLDADKITAFIIAGVENASTRLKTGDEPPTSDEIIETLGYQEFIEIVTAAFAMPGRASNGSTGEQLPNPSAPLAG